MNLLKKRGVAVIITILVIALMSFVGFVKAPAELPPVETGHWVYDGANVLSPEQESQLTEINKNLLSDHGAVVAVATMPDVKGWDLMDFCAALGDTWGLNPESFILVLDIGGDNYWLVQGYGLLDLFTDDMAGQYAWQLLENDFAAKNYGAGVLNLVNGLQGWYDGPYTLAGQLNIGDHNDPNLGFYGDTPSSSPLGGIFLLILFVVILILVLDGLRYSSYRHRVRVRPTIVYRPLFFGRPWFFGSPWFFGPTRRPPPPPPPGGFGAGPRPGGTRPSSGEFGGGRRTSGGFSGGRSGSFGGGRSSGGFGGGRGGGRR